MMIYIYMYVCMYGWMDGWMDVCMYVCICVYVYVYIYIRMANKMMGNDDENILWVNPQSWLIMVNNGNHLLNLWIDNSWSYHFRLVKIKSYGSWLMVVILPAKIVVNNGLPSSIMAICMVVCIAFVRWN
jgi:hypothetical protein